MVAVTASDADRPIPVTPSEDIVITLDENPTTGFRWTVESISGDLTLVSSEFESPADVKPGAGGHRAIRVRAGARGTGDLHLRYSREWEGSAASARRCRFTFVIRSA